MKQVPVCRERILFLSYTGLLEPLGRSQVLAYISRLSDEFSFTVVSFEKKQDMSDSRSVADMRHQCKELGIVWIPRAYHHRPRMFATAFDLLVMMCIALYYCIFKRISLVHSRSYIPTMVAWLCGKITRTPYLFDMRALWPEELISSGRMKDSGILYRAIKFSEQRMLCDAAGIVSLTKAAVEHLRHTYPETCDKRYQVITTCVDLERFSTFPKPSSHGANNPLVVGALGTLTSGWFHLDWLFRAFIEIKRTRPSAVLKLVTRDNRDKLLMSASACGICIDDVTIVSSQPQDVPGHLAEMNVVLMFFKSGIAKLGSAPTRMAEVLACGIPVMGNAGVGDMDHLIQHYDVGVVMENGSSESVTAAVESLFTCLEDVDIGNRCQFAAKQHFSADIGAQRYRELYGEIIGS